MQITIGEPQFGDPSELIDVEIAFLEQTLEAVTIGEVMIPPTPESPFPLTVVTDSCADAQLDPELAGFPCIDTSFDFPVSGIEVATVIYDGSGSVTVEVPEGMVTFGGQINFADDAFCWHSVTGSIDSGVTATTADVSALCA